MIVTNHRTLCRRCLQSASTCYCGHLRRFDPKIRFVILIHPIEARRRIATGRMTYLTLERSHLILGEDYSENREVNAILEDPRIHSVMLYPARDALNLSERAEGATGEWLPSDRELAVFVVDGTWATARKMVRSRNLARLPRICFTPSEPSRFRVRKQPAPGCLSTIEAVHRTIELLGSAVGFDVSSRTHDSLLNVFDSMVERQLTFTPHSSEHGL